MIRFLFPALLLAAQLSAERIDFSWPTPNPAWEQHKPIAAFVQATVSGDPSSGLFGCVRTSGRQFHEGVDIRPLRRDSRGEPADRVTAAMAGVVRHVAARPGESSYGRYIVIEHAELHPAVYTLYAHLAAVEPGIAPGRSVAKGQPLGTMGHSAGGYTIPRDRAHLHFEIGLRATDSFQSWYDWRKFGSPNQHSVWNGMNLMGIDPLDFLDAWRRGEVSDFRQYFDRMTPAVRVRVVTTRTPDFIRRYPALLTRAIPTGLVGGWEIACNATGLPFAWTPLSVSDVSGLRNGAVEIIGVNAAVVRATACKSLVKTLRGGAYRPGADLQTMLQLVFGLRR